MYPLGAWRGTPCADGVPRVRIAVPLLRTSASTRWNATKSTREGTSAPREVTSPTATLRYHLLSLAS
eukprot:3405539-Pyramimonas_sp.AAC.2